MSEKYVIELTEEQYKTLDERARQQGYEDVAAYVVALADEDTAEDEPTTAELLAGFREAWHDAMTGNTHPASVLWDDAFWDDDADV